MKNNIVEEISGYFASLEDGKVADTRVDQLWEAFVQLDPQTYPKIRDELRELVDELIPEIAP